MNTSYNILILLFILFLPFNIYSKKPILLDNWTISANGNERKTKAVNWETPIENGGPGLYNYDGIASYKTEFIIPESCRHKPIAFFSYMIDDADITSFNGVPVGETGKFPNPENQISTFRSGVREPRCYILPESLIKYGDYNTLEIKVFDFAGNGGFTANEPPEIDLYNKLIKRKELLKTANDIPRTIVMSFQIALIIIFLILIINKELYKHTFKIFKKIGSLFNISKILSNEKYEVRLSHTNELLFKFTLVILFNICYFIALFSEISIKYFFIESEIFWFKSPAIAIFAAFYFINMLLYGDIYAIQHEEDVIFIRKFALKLFLFITNPGIIIWLGVYLALLPAKETWNTFIITGIQFMFFFTIIHMLYSASIMITSRNKYSKSKIKRVLFYEGILRFIFILAFATALSLVIMGTQYWFSFTGIIITFFSMIYGLISTLFYTRNNLLISEIQNKTKFNLFQYLQNEYRLTYKEAQIAEKINEHLNRKQIAEELDIKESTVKVHLKSIYSKIIGNDESLGNGGNKFIKLYTFLNKISN